MSGDAGAMLKAEARELERKALVLTERARRLRREAAQVRLEPKAVYGSDGPYRPTGRASE